MKIEDLSTGNIVSYFDEKVIVKRIFDDSVEIVDSENVTESVDIREISPVEPTKELLELIGFKEVYDSHIHTRFEKNRVRYRITKTEGFDGSGVSYHGQEIKKSNAMHIVQNLEKFLNK